MAGRPYVTGIVYTWQDTHRRQEAPYIAEIIPLEKRQVFPFRRESVPAAGGKLCTQLVFAAIVYIVSIVYTKYTINIHPRSGWFFIFGHSPYTISCPQVGTECLPACDCYLLPVNGSLGSNKLNWSDSLSTFSWFAMYSLIAFVFFPTVST